MREEKIRDTPLVRKRAIKETSTGALFDRWDFRGVKLRRVEIVLKDRERKKEMKEDISHAGSVQVIYRYRYGFPLKRNVKQVHFWFYKIYMLHPLHSLEVLRM